MIKIQSYTKKGRVCISELEFQNGSIRHVKVSKFKQKCMKSCFHFEVKVSNWHFKSIVLMLKFQVRVSKLRC